MEVPRKASFGNDTGQGLTVLEVISQARAGFAAMNSGKIDAISRCVLEEDGDWSVVIDVVEGAARIGQNDLLCAYEIRVTPQGRIGGFRRVGRYHREDGETP